MSRQISGATLAAVMVFGGPASAMADDTLSVVTYAGLRALDPHLTTSFITRNHAYMIYDVLVAQGADFQPQPQMAEWKVSEDGLVYTFTLREGLLFHDGEPVRSADAVASLKRWGERDFAGRTLFGFTDGLDVVDDRTFSWNLNKPFPALLEVISKQSSIPPFIMPERVAATPSDTAITDYTGSGPFRFLGDQFQPGVQAIYEKFDQYMPRSEPQNWMAGGKIANFDSVKWLTMPDPQTAVNALISGEVDMVETVPLELLPMLEISDDIVAEVRSDMGFQLMARLNFKHAPFDNVDIRRAALRALSQEDVLATMIGNPDYYQVCGAIFGCGTPLADDTNSASLTSGGDKEAARKLLEEAGYDGSPVVILQPADNALLAPPPVAIAQALREAGFNVDLQTMDWQTLLTRRASQSAPAEGGWSVFVSYFSIPEVSSPISSLMLDARGDEGWFGWPDDRELVDLREEYIEATTPEARKDVAQRMQARVLDNVVYIPLGEYKEVQARSVGVTEMIPSPVPVYWGIGKVN